MLVPTLLAGAYLRAQAAPAFDVASVKINRSGRTGWDLADPSHGTLHVENASLVTLVAAAYQTQRERIVGGPEWARTARFDIDAKGDARATPADVWRMLQVLLTSRFQLRAQTSTRQLRLFELQPIKGGPHLPAPSGPAASPNVLTGRGSAMVVGQNVDAGDLADALAIFLQRPVTDRTGITQRFSLGEAGLVWDTGFAETAAEVAHANAEAEAKGQSAPGSRDPGRSLSTALKETLGLQLRSTTGPVAVLVITQANLPAPN